MATKIEQDEAEFQQRKDRDQPNWDSSWATLVACFSVNPEAATRHDIAHMAACLLEYYRDDSEVDPTDALQFAEQLRALLVTQGE